MLAKKKICISCNTEQYIFSRKMCKGCASKNPKPKSNLREPVKKVMFKPTGEGILFQSIWATRPHKCVICNEPLKEYSVWFFSHVLAKSSFPLFRLYDKNILLKCKQHHIDYTEKSINDLMKSVEYGDKWKEINDLHDELVREYYLERF